MKPGTLAHAVSVSPAFAQGRVPCLWNSERLSMDDGGLLGRAAEFLVGQRGL